MLYFDVSEGICMAGCIEINKQTYSFYICSQLIRSHFLAHSYMKNIECTDDLEFATYILVSMLVGWSLHTDGRAVTLPIFSIDLPIYILDDL